MPSLRYLNVVLTVIAILLTLNLWTQWTASPATAALESEAQAQAIDPGSQRKAMIDELKLTNAKLGEVVDALKNGTARVRVEAGASDK